MPRSDTRTTQRRLRRGALAAITAGTCCLAATPANANGDYWTINYGSISIDGGGYGHGRGMSQWGSQGAATQGKSYRDILSFYYPGATISSTTQHFNRNIRVRLDNRTAGNWFRIASVDGTLTVTDQGNNQTATLDGAPYFRVWGEDDGTWKVQKTDARTFSDDIMTLSGTARFTSSSGTVRVIFSDGSSAEYRGEIVGEVDNSRVYPVNHLSLDDYLKSVVPSESPASWHLEALKAQAVAARSYAVAGALSRGATSYYDQCATTACQVYTGTAKEAWRTSKAVTDTSGQVLSYGGKVARTEFSSSNGGQSVKSTAYTASRQDPYDGAAGSSVHRWSVTVEGRKLSNRWPEIGTPIYAKVTKRDGNGPFGGRIDTVRVVGTKGSVNTTGDALRWALGIRSTLAAGKTTGIIWRWVDSGAETGYLGDLRSAEYGVHGGRMQDFERGNIMWSPQFGPHALIGAIRHKYFSIDGPKNYGPPLTGEFSIMGGQQQNFQHTTIVWSPQHDAHHIYGGIKWKFDQMGGANVVGVPLGDEKDHQQGRSQSFANGEIVWNKNTGHTTWNPS